MHTGKKDWKHEAQEYERALKEAVAEVNKLQSRNAALAEEKQKLSEQAEHYKKKFEDMLIRFVKQQVITRSAQASADYFGKEVISLTTKMFERGARRAEYDEHYAIFRELLISGRELTQENFMVLVKANPNANIPGLVQVAEEFGMTINIELVQRDPVAKTYQSNWETTKNEDGTWKVEATFKDMVAYVSAKEE